MCLAAYRQLAAKEPIKWVLVKCTVLPDDVDDALVFALLGQFHPRVYSIVRADGRQPSQEEIQEKLCEMEHVKWQERKVPSLIETHSANILLRLRKLVSKGDLKADDISVAFLRLST